MKFDLNRLFNAVIIAVTGFAVLLISIMESQAQSVKAQLTAVVPRHIIYPGQEISSEMVREVTVINPNLRPGYARVIADVAGLVTKKTLLPGRTIQTNMLRETYLIERGKKIAMVFSSHNMIITARGIALQNGSLGEVIRARNIDTNIIIVGTVMNDGTLKVIKQ